MRRCRFVLVGLFPIRGFSGGHLVPVNGGEEGDDQIDTESSQRSLQGSERGVKSNPSDDA